MIMRRLLLKASQNAWLRQRAMSRSFLRRASRRFLPGETLEEAFAACQGLAQHGVGSILTYLGENVANYREAAEVATQYCEILERIPSSGLSVDVSVKLTQLGLDLDSDLCFSNLTKLLDHSPSDNILWIDMEQSCYVDPTFELFWRARRTYPHVGICVQAYLRRTENDVNRLIAAGAAVRLVKGAYNELPEVALPKKRDVDDNYYRLARKLLENEARRAGVRAALATHDCELINRLSAWVASEGIDRRDVEFQMLYGIQRTEQVRLAEAGYRMRVLVSYGSCWFPWFMRRLAERPANVLFLARNLISD
jgi:proline dehydrogenase